MFVVTKFIDAVTDYLVGTWVDRTDTKMGRYRSWMLFGAPVLAVGMVLLFSVPIGWGKAGGENHERKANQYRGSSKDFRAYNTDFTAL